jgi:hypothetical protein
MDSSRTAEPNRAFAALRRFVRKRTPIEKCELCSAVLGAAHQHLIEISNHKLVCACDPCAILFGNQGSQNPSRYRRLSRRLLYLPDLQLTADQWERLRIPINLTFIFYNSPAGKAVALYPGPAGATESLPDQEIWEEIVRQNSILREMNPDVEALLVKRGELTQEQNEYYLVPIDECYRLVGLIRARWRGLSGGGEVWQEISRFFADLRQRSETRGEAGRA